MGGKIQYRTIQPKRWYTLKLGGVAWSVRLRGDGTLHIVSEDSSITIRAYGGEVFLANEPQTKEE